MSLLKKILKVTAITIGIVLLLVAGWYAYALYHVSNKYRIPSDIVAAKDCKRYREFVQSLAAPGFIPSDDCPWAVVKPIARFSLGDKMFYVPREYLWLGSKEEDGVKDGINLMFKYPEMTPGDSWAKDQSMNIPVVIGLINKEKICEGKRCRNWEKYLYESRSQIDRSLGERKFYPAYPPYPHLTGQQMLRREDFAPVRINYDKELKLTRYYSKQFVNLRKKSPRSGGQEMLVRGDPFAPTYWLLCGERSALRPRCESAFLLAPRMSVEYSFRKSSLLPHHDDIRKKIHDKLIELQQIPETKEQLHAQ